MSGFQCEAPPYSSSNIPREESTQVRRRTPEGESADRRVHTIWADGDVVVALHAVIEDDSYCVVRLG